MHRSTLNVTCQNLFDKSCLQLHWHAAIHMIFITQKHCSSSIVRFIDALYSLAEDLLEILSWEPRDSCDIRSLSLAFALQTME